MTKLVHDELSYQIIGSCFEVHNEIGGGHRESFYQKGLAAVLRQREIPFQEQVHVDLVVAGEKVGKYFLDFLVDKRVIIEIKSSKFFRQSDFRQATAYLQALKLELALLVAFTPTGVRYKRVVNL